MSGFTTGTIPLGSVVKATDPSYSNYEQQLGHRFLSKKGQAYKLVKIGVVDPLLAPGRFPGLAMDYGTSPAGRGAWTVVLGTGGDFAGGLPTELSVDTLLEVGDILYVQVGGRGRFLSGGAFTESQTVQVGAGGKLIAGAGDIVSDVGVAATASGGADEPVDVDIFGLAY